MRNEDAGTRWLGFCHHLVDIIGSRPPRHHLLGFNRPDADERTNSRMVEESGRSGRSRGGSYAKYETSFWSLSLGVRGQGNPYSPLIAGAIRSRLKRRTGWAGPLAPTLYSIFSFVFFFGLSHVFFGSVFFLFGFCWFC
jgi:hypothetical protein